MQTARPLPCNSGQGSHSSMAENAPRPFCFSGPRIRQMPLQGGPPPDLKDHGSAFADLRMPEIRTSLFSRLSARGLERPPAPRVRPRPHGPASAPAARRGLPGAVPTIPASRGRAPPRPPPRPPGQGCAGLSPDRRHMSFGHLGGDRGAPNRKRLPLTARLKESCGFRGAEGDPPAPFRTLRALLIGAGLSRRLHPGSGAAERAPAGGDETEVRRTPNREE